MVLMSSIVGFNRGYNDGCKKKPDKNKKRVRDEEELWGESKKE